MKSRDVQSGLLSLGHHLLHRVFRAGKSKRRRRSKSGCTFSLHADVSHEPMPHPTEIEREPPHNEEERQGKAAPTPQQIQNGNEREGEAIPPHDEEEIEGEMDSSHRDNAVDNLFLALTVDEEIEVYDALCGSNREEVLVTHQKSNIEISRKVIQCLSPNQCVTDDVINLYFELLKEREKRDPTKFLKCHFFNTFFYVKLLETGEYNYEAVKKWTTHKKLGYSLLECCSVVVPIHRYNHWCLVIINIKENTIQYFDSLNRRGDGILEALAKYIADEAKDKCMKNLDLEMRTWKHEHVKDLPQQSNGYDCGIFMMKYADFHSRGMLLNFSQADIPYFRRRTVKEILRLRAD